MGMIYKAISLILPPQVPSASCFTPLNLNLTPVCSLTNEELLRGVKTAWDKGWKQVKLYFMIGGWHGAGMAPGAGRPVHAVLSLRVRWQALGCGCDVLLACCTGQDRAPAPDVSC